MFGIWLLGDMRTLVWGSKDEAQSCQVNGEARRSQNLKDFVRGRALLLNKSQFALCYMEMAGFARDLMRKIMKILIAAVPRIT